MRPAPGAGILAHLRTAFELALFTPDSRKLHVAQATQVQCRHCREPLDGRRRSSLSIRYGGEANMNTSNRQIHRTAIVLIIVIALSTPPPGLAAAQEKKTIAYRSEAANSKFVQQHTLDVGDVAG